MTVTEQCQSMTVNRKVPINGEECQSMTVTEKCQSMTVDRAVSINDSDRAVSINDSEQKSANQWRRVSINEWTEKCQSMTVTEKC